MTRVIVVSDQLTNRVALEGALPSNCLDDLIVPREKVPSPEQFAKTDLVIVVGPLSDGGHAIVTGGALRLAADAGATIVYLYRVRPDSQDAFAIRKLGIELVHQASSAAEIRDPHPAFHRYLTQFGLSATGFASNEPTVEPEPLGYILELQFPSALYARLGKGHLYVLPHHAPGSTECP